MPLGVKEIKIPPAKSDETNPKLAALRLLEFENDLYSDTVKNQKRKKRKTEDEPGQSSQSGASPPKKKKCGKEKLLKKEKKDKKINKALNMLLNNDKKIKAKKVELIEKSEDKKIKKSKRRSLDSVTVDSVDDKVKNPLFFMKSKRRRHTLGTWEVSDNPIQPVPAVQATPTKISPAVQDKPIQPVPAVQATPTKISPVVQDKPNRTNSNNITMKKVVKSSPTTRQTTNSNKLRNEVTLRPVIKKLDKQLIDVLKSPKTPEKKRVKIMLQKNTMQHTSEYFQQLRMSPGIPYDANRKPLTGVLKASPLPSPINPFYIRKERKCTS